MAEYSYIPIQTVGIGANVIFDTRIGCKNNNIIHRENSGLFTLKPNKYKVNYNMNIAVPTGATVGEISTALSLQGEPLLNTNAIVTPTTTDDYFNVSATTFVSIPCGCCGTLSVGNTSGIPINVQNANIVIERVM